MVNEKDLDDAVRHIVGATVAFINAKTATDMNCSPAYWEVGLHDHIEAAKAALRRCLEPKE